MGIRFSEIDVRVLTLDAQIWRLCKTKKGLWTSNRRGLWILGCRDFKLLDWHERIYQLVLTQTRYVEFDVQAGKLRVLDEPFFCSTSTATVVVAGTLGATFDYSTFDSSSSFSHSRFGD